MSKNWGAMKNTGVTVGKAIVTLVILGLIYVFYSAFYFASVQASHGQLSIIGLLGYGVSQLSYMLLAAGLFSGTFYAFNIKSRMRVLFMAIASACLGFYLVN